MYTYIVSRDILLVAYNRRAVSRRYQSHLHLQVVVPLHPRWTPRRSVSRSTPRDSHATSTCITTPMQPPAVSAPPNARTSLIRARETPELPNSLLREVSALSRSPQARDRFGKQVASGYFDLRLHSSGKSCMRQMHVSLPFFLVLSLSFPVFLASSVTAPSQSPVSSFTRREDLALRNNSGIPLLYSGSWKCLYRREARLYNTGTHTRVRTHRSAYIRVN